MTGTTAKTSSIAKAITAMLFFLSIPCIRVLTTIFQHTDLSAAVCYIAPFNCLVVQCQFIAFAFIWLYLSAVGSVN